jgi:hypothetical protein
MKTDYLTLTREELYELAWSKPMTELAQDFGISDVALAKRCRRLCVSVPGRGYWARVKHGQKPGRPKLPKPTPSTEANASALVFGVSPEPITPPTPPDVPPRDQFESIDVSVNPDLTDLHPAAKRTAAKLKRPWRSGMKWPRGHRTGPVINLVATPPSQDRALQIADVLLRASETMGWKFLVPPPKETDYPRRRSPYYQPEAPAHVNGVFEIDQEHIEFRIEEICRRVEHVLTEEEKLDIRLKRSSFIPRWDDEHRGELRLKLTSTTYSHISFQTTDKKRTKLEGQLKDILRTMLALAVSVKQTRERHRQDEIARCEEEHRRAKQAQLREAHEKLARELEREAGAWHYARLLRAYIRAARRAVGSGRLEATLLNEKIDFLNWATAYVDQLDPLCSTGRNPDLRRDRYSYYVSPEEKPEALIYRLLGGEWQATPKIQLLEDDS